MSERLRMILGTVFMAGALLLSVLAAASQPRNSAEFYPAREYTERKVPETAEIRIPDTGGIDVNTADEEELTNLYGIGLTLAEAIVAEREDNGPFFYPEDLINVSGIGLQKLNGFRELIRTEAMEGQ